MQAKIPLKIQVVIRFSIDRNPITLARAAEQHTTMKTANSVCSYFPVRCIAALALCFVSIAAAQAPPSQAPAAPAAETAQTPTISTNVDEVALDFVAHDKKNSPVLDIKPEDVTVTDNGTPVKINGLHLVKGDATRGLAVTFVFDRFGGSLAKSVQVLAEKVLKALPEKDASVAVFDLGSRLRLIQGFSDRRRTVEDAIAMATESRAITTQTRDMKNGLVVDPAEDVRVKAAAEAERSLIAIARTGTDAAGAHVTAADRALAETVLKALEETHTIAHEQHAPVALAAMLAIVKSQEKLNERKALIYFTTNRQMDTAQKQFLKTIEAAASRSGVTIYTVDMDALDVGAQYQMEAALGTRGINFNQTPIVTGCGGGHCTTVTPTLQQSPMPIGESPVEQATGWGAAQDVAVVSDFHRQSNDYAMFAAKSPMADLAVNTGGIYIDAQVNVKHPLEQMAEDMSTYYEATYAPPSKEYDGSFHSIVVKPVRANVHVKYKTGYYALAPGADGSIPPFEAPLLKMLGDMKLPADVEFRAALLRFGDLAGGNTTTVAVEVPLSGLQTKQDTNTNLFSAHVTVAGRIRDKAGVVVENFGEDIVKRGALEQLDRDQKGDQTGTIEMHRYFITTPGDYTLEVAVLDVLSGKVGAERIPFTIPPPVMLSDMVLVRKLDPVRENEDDDPLEPLRYDKGRVTPSLMGELPENAKGVSVFFIVHPDPATVTAPVLELEVTRNGRPGRRTPVPLNAKLGADGAAVPNLSSFGAALAPGDYTVKAFFTQNGKSEQRQISFHVAGEAAAAGGAAPAAKVDVALTMGNTGTHEPGGLAIGAATNPFPPLAAAEAHQLLEDARQAALDYSEGLPNFMCVEVTNRSVDSSASGRWKLQDTIVELLRYRDRTETRNTLEVNGKTSSLDRGGMKGSTSTGEFGGVLQSIFGEKSKADFEWKETDELNGQPVQVFNYKVAQANSSFGVVDTDNREFKAAFHGQVFIDAATRRVRRVTLIADEMPERFRTRATSIGVDYDYVSINSHDYLLPVSAEMRLVKGHAAVLNTMEFRDYKRFGSSMRIVDYGEPGDAPAGKPDAARPETQGTKPQ
jgi:VWFA-related protein